jgi:hypothetical protein
MFLGQVGVNIVRPGESDTYSSRMVILAHQQSVGNVKNACLHRLFPLSRWTYKTTSIRLRIAMLEKIREVVYVNAELGEEKQAKSLLCIIK